jgi:hypothetical protein
MGRYIHELTTGKFVWKYVVAEQPSEQERLHIEYGLGRYRWGDGGDILILDRDSDIPKLHELADEFRPTVEAFDRETEPCWDTLEFAGDTVQGLPLNGPKHDLYEEIRRRYPDVHFKAMVVAMSDFAKEHPELEELRFEGEL